MYKKQLANSDQKICEVSILDKKMQDNNHKGAVNTIATTATQKDDIWTVSGQAAKRMQECQENNQSYLKFWQKFD